MTVTLWTEPRVTLLGTTQPTMNVHSFGWLHADDATPEELLPIFGGRACYQAFGDKAGRKTAADYLRNILDQKHLSVLEHSLVVFYLEGVSRTLTHELVRHRHLGYSQLSQRYVNHAEEIGIVIPPVLLTDPDHVDYWKLWYRTVGEDAMFGYREIQSRLEMLGTMPVKEINQAARSVLPGCTETKIVVSGNLRAWYEVLEKRDSPHADAEIARLARILRDQLAGIAPHVFTRTKEPVAA